MVHKLANICKHNNTLPYFNWVNRFPLKDHEQNINLSQPPQNYTPKSPREKPLFTRHHKGSTLYFLHRPSNYTFRLHFWANTLETFNFNFSKKHLDVQSSNRWHQKHPPFFYTNKKTEKDALSANYLHLWQGSHCPCFIAKQLASASVLPMWSDVWQKKTRAKHTSTRYI